MNFFVAKQFHMKQSHCMILLNLYMSHESYAAGIVIIIMYVPAGQAIIYLENYH